MSSSALSQRALFIVKTTSQVVLFSLIWIVADFISRRYLPLVPGSVLGMLIVVALLGCRILHGRWLAMGATWLLGEMLLFFIPAVVSIIQYPQLLRENGLAIVAVIVASTACVMTATALAVDITWKLEAHWRSRSTGNDHGDMP